MGISRPSTCLTWSIARSTLASPLLSKSKFAALALFASRGVTVACCGFLLNVSTLTKIRAPLFNLSGIINLSAVTTDLNNPANVMSKICSKSID